MRVMRNEMGPDGADVTPGVLWSPPRGLGAHGGRFQGCGKDEGAALEGEAWGS